MIIANTGRYLPAPVLPSSVRFWNFQEQTQASNDLIGAVNLTPGAGPMVPVVKSPTSLGRKFDGTNYLGGGNDATARTALLGDCTLVCMVRSDVAISAERTILAFAGESSSGLAAENDLFVLGHQADGKLYVEWESAPGVFHRTFTDPYYMYRGRWYQVVVTRTGSTVKIYINGALVINNLATGLPADGTNARWTVGARLTTGPTVFGDFFEGVVDHVHLYDSVLIDEEVEDMHRRLFLLQGASQVRTTVHKEDAALDQVDLSCFKGYDWIKSTSIKEDTDSGITTADVKLFKTYAELNLSPLREDTSVNISDPTDVTTYQPMFQVGDAFDVLCARMPLDIAPAGSDWTPRFSGFVDKLDWGSDEVGLVGRDICGKLIDHYIEEEQQYGDLAGVGFADIGEMQDILDDNSATNFLGAYDSPSLFRPYDSNWDLLAWQQRREPVFSALRTISGQIAWDIRCLWDPVTEGFRLTYYDPDRLRNDADFNLSPSDILSVSDASILAQRIRNVVRVVFKNSGRGLTFPAAPPGYVQVDRDWGQDSEDNPLNAWIQLLNSVSVAKYGRRFCEISEASSSIIDRPDECWRMAYGIAQDLSEPEFSHSVQALSLFEAHVQDVGRFLPNKRMYSSPQRLAVQSVTHQLGPKYSSSFQLRGKPSAGVKRWLNRESRPGIAQPPNVDPNQSLADSTTNKLLPGFANIIDRSRLLNGGRFFRLTNGDFTRATRGQQYEPDGWYAHEWDTAAGAPTSVVDPTPKRFDATGIVYQASGEQLTGGWSLCFPDASPSTTRDMLVTDYMTVPVLSSQVGLDYIQSFKVTVVHTELGGGGGTAPPLVTLWCYDEDKVLIPTVGATRAGGPVALSPVITGAGASWYAHERVIQTQLGTGGAYNIPNNTRFIRLGIANDHVGEDTCVDRVEITPVASQASGNATGALAATYNVWQMYTGILATTQYNQFFTNGGAETLTVDEAGRYTIVWTVKAPFSTGGVGIVTNGAGAAITHNTVSVGQTSTTLLDPGGTDFVTTTTVELDLAPGDTLGLHIQINAAGAPPFAGATSMVEIKKVSGE